MAETTPSRSTLRAALASAQSAAELAERFLQERKRLREANQAQPQGGRACRALTEATDLVLQRMFQLSLPEEPAAREAIRPKIAVVATGGYGRRELCPFSDIDVTFLVAEEEDPVLDAIVRRMFLLLMEIFGQRAGLKVGYAYRSQGDAPQLDHPTQTALLDARLVVGSHGLTERFLRRVFQHIWPAAFVRQKAVERRRARERLGGTLYAVEPELREGPGGLRDLHLAEWLAAVSFPSTRGDIWGQLQRLGVVSRRDVQQVAAAREFLLTLRTWMHWETGRAADLLVRERQERLAELLRFEDDARASRVERFMERYYEHAENVNRVAGFILERCLSERLSLTDELVCSGNELFAAYPWVRIARPQFLVELGQHFQELGLAPGHELRRMIAEHLDSCPDLSTDGEAAEDFVGLLRGQPPGHAPRGAAASDPARAAGNAATVWAGRPQSGGLCRPGVHETLSLMADLGILQRLLPELGEAYRRVPFDPVHRHTIGHHCLETVRALERLRTTEDDRLQEFRRIWAEVAAPELLYLAALLHDIGKLAPAGGHSEQGADMAAAICERLRLDGPAARQVCFLVRHHLLMSETAQLRDLTLEKTIQDFVAVVDSLELLHMLMLLTYADMEATGVLSPMKIRFLEDLYFRAEPALSAAAPSLLGDEERARRFRSRISRRLSAANLSPEQIREHTEGMPVSYLLNTSPEQMALHIRMMEALRRNGPVVEFENEPGAEITQLHVCTLERPEPGLLSQIAGVLHAHDVDVHGAQVFTRHSSAPEGGPDVALDTLWVDYHGRVLPPIKRLELEQDLVAVLKGLPVEELLGRRSKRLPPPTPPRSVRVDDTLSESHTVVEIEADDQPALLYRITRAMAALGWNIHSARISTRGDRARDAFYVTTRDGRKLEAEESELVDAFLAEFAR